jgi:hypothetical protein
MKIIKKITTVEVQEIDIELPVYFKKDSSFYKINEDETIDTFSIQNQSAFFIEKHYDSIETVINYESATQEEWWNGLKICLEKVHSFVFKSGEKVKDEGKKEILIAGRLYDNLYGVINNTSKGLEMQCEEIEKFQELKDLKMREDRKLIRIEQLTPYVADVSFFDLLNMEEAAFSQLLATQKAGKEAPEAAAKKAEEGIIAKEKADAEAREAQRLENEKLKAEAAIKEKEIADAKAKADAELKAEQEKSRKEKEAADAILKKEREEAEAQRKEIEKKAAEEKAIADAKLKEAQAAQAKVEAELKAKADAEAKAIKDAADKADAELKAKIAAEKKAAKAPDKVKLTEMINSLELKVINLSPDSDHIYSQIAEKFIGFKKWALQKIKSI